MRIKLLSHTPSPDMLVYKAARCCYDPVDMTTDNSIPSINTAKKLINHLYTSGHTSTFEHASFTFAINGISRACSHQLVRHRIGFSFSQQSQRYVTIDNSLYNENNPAYVVPQTVLESEVYKSALDSAFHYYKELIEDGVPAEDARYVLPNAWSTQIVVTANARALHHFFTLRLCKRAQWEIRELARLMLIEVRNVAPLLFEKAGPTCVLKGYCEEAMTCGEPYKDLEDCLGKK